MKHFLAILESFRYHRATNCKVVQQAVPRRHIQMEDCKSLLFLHLQLQTALIVYPSPVEGIAKLGLLRLYLTMLGLPESAARIFPIYTAREQAQKKMVGSRKTVKVGPWGGHGGSPWDDEIHTGIREITLIHDRCIDSIQVEYDQNGKPFLGEKHGGLGGSVTTKIKLLYPDEYLITVSGHSCPVANGGYPVIRSLTFKSNLRTLGPFGVEEGTPFSLPTDGGMIVGFNGKSGWYLDSIGWRLSATRSVMYETLQQKLRKFAMIATKPFTTAKPQKINA